MLPQTRAARINLLPWREELRERRKQDFFRMTIMVLVFAALVVGGTDRFYSWSIDQQGARNDFLTQEVSVLDERIEEIKSLQQKRSELLSRMRVIQELQGNRSVIVRVLDELADKLSPGIFFTDLTRVGTTLSIAGIAGSNHHISDQLRKLAESHWFEQPNVTEIKAIPQFGWEASQFNLTVVHTISPPKDTEASRNGDLQSH